MSRFGVMDYHGRRSPFGEVGNGFLETVNSKAQRITQVNESECVP